MMMSEQQQLTVVLEGIEHAGGTMELGEEALGKGMVVQKNPDITAFRAKVSGLKDMQLYQDPRVKALLLQFLDATR